MINVDEIPGWRQQPEEWSVNCLDNGDFSTERSQRSIATLKYKTCQNISDQWQLWTYRQVQKGTARWSPGRWSHLFELERERIPFATAWRDLKCCQSSLDQLALLCLIQPKSCFDPRTQRWLIISLVSIRTLKTFSAKLLSSQSA